MSGWTEEEQEWLALGAREDDRCSAREWDTRMDRAAAELTRRDKRIKELEAVCREAAKGFGEVADLCREGSSGKASMVAEDIAKRLEEAANG